MKNTNKILLVEDDINFGSVLKSYLELNDFDVVHKTDGILGLNAFRNERFNLCIIDVMMPNMDGFTLAKEINSSGAPVPFIFLTSKTLKTDIIEGFKSGAYDYITKPFDTEVFLYKIRAVLKARSSSTESSESQKLFKIGSYLFNYKLRTISSVDFEKVLSPKEAKLLQLLCIHMDQVLPRELALTSIWGNNNYFTTRSMDVYITKLRKYLKNDGCIEIINIHGDGYMLTIKELGEKTALETTE